MGVYSVIGGWLNSSVVESVQGVAPNLVLASVVLVLAAICIRYVMGLFESRMQGTVDEGVGVGVLTLSVRVGLWFLVSLVVLSVLGFSEMAQAFGTSSGFLAIGVSYIMKDAIKEAVAGFYLMGDDDYFVGARVVADGVEGVIVETKLQRTKIRTEEGDIVTLSNQKIEPKWLRVSESE